MLHLTKSSVHVNNPSQVQLLLIVQLASLHLSELRLTKVSFT